MPIRTPKDELDIVHSHGPFTMGWYALRVSMKKSIPRVATFHTLLNEYLDYVPKPAQFATKVLAKDYLSLYYNRFHKVITPSQAIKEILPKKVQKKTIIIPTGVRPLERVPNAKKKLGIKEKKVYLYLGRLGFEKDIDVLIKASDSFLNKDSILLIVGKGPALKDLKAKAKRKRIKFIGFIPEKDKALYYSAADIFITPSATETQGLTILEAMSTGTPVIGADAYAIPEMITEGKDGYLFEPKNPKELARIVQYHDFPKTMSKNAISKAKKFSVKRTTKSLEKVYENLI